MAVAYMKVVDYQWQGYGGGRSTGGLYSVTSFDLVIQALKQISDSVMFWSCDQIPYTINYA